MMMSGDMILMNPNHDDTERLRALEVLQRLRDAGERMGIKMDEITLAIDRLLRSQRITDADAVFRDLTVEQMNQMLDETARDTRKA